MALVGQSMGAWAVDGPRWQYQELRSAGLSRGDARNAFEGPKPGYEEASHIRRANASANRFLLQKHRARIERTGGDQAQV